MNKIELKNKLDKLNVDPLFYTLDGENIPDRVILMNNYKIWQVFYLSERGDIDNMKTYSNEEDACQYMYEYLTKYIV